MDRRALLLGTAGLFTLAGAAGAAAGDQAAAARLNTIFDGMMKEILDRSPQTTTTLGLDKGARAAQKAQLDASSVAAWERDKRVAAEQLARLRAVDPAPLGLQDRINYDSVLYVAALNDEQYRRLPYVGAPYVLSQLSGSYQSVPDFLDSQHSIETRQDAEDYLSRLSAFAAVMDQELEQFHHDAALGVVPPDFVLDKMLIQARALRDNPPERSILVQSLVSRTRDKQLGGDWERRAGDIYARQVQPAVGRQIDAAQAARPGAVHDAGVSRLPQGELLYALALKQATTVDTPPAEIHRTGLDLVARHVAEIDALMKAQGLTQGTVADRFRALYADPQYRYPDTEEGRLRLIGDLNVKVERVQARLPQWFGTLPKAKLNIRRVPAATQAGAPGGYYEAGALDGSRPGAYYINLRDTAEVPRWTLPTLTFHEGIPGHHLQLSLAQETDLPLIRKVQFFSGYGEGWALYAEQLAVEMGMYDDDPLGHIGQLHDSLFRCVRLVVDTGLHAQGWSREKAVQYFVDTLGDQQTSATTEVERYCVWPGQACSYMLGKLQWLRLRDRARAALGPRFDIRRFHDAGLLSGAMPLKVLADRMQSYSAAG